MGMGGGLLQKVNRDTCKYAMKANAVCINGEWRDVYKDPITDQGKASKRGRLALVKRPHNGWLSIRRDDLPDPRADRLRTVYEDGKLIVDEDFETIRARAAL